MSDFSIRQMNQADAPGTRIVVVTGEATIQNAGEIRAALLEAFSQGERVCLEMEKVSGADLTGLQLLCSAHRTSMAEKKHLTVTGIENEALRCVIRDAGFSRPTGCAEDVDKTCIWTGGERQWQK